ncbi:unnamed protein product [Meganyctiphanes norvegica]|uniref:Uncharacterized protein n=1 Tax=Meganyctiphanes norvegica TaxID=48144 RepID=A0AAV2QDA3_MEGNR
MASFTNLFVKGRPGERVECKGYINNSGIRVSKKLYELEKGHGSRWTEGNVYGLNSDTAGFAICTRTMPNYRMTWVAIGHVISGLPEFKEAIDKYKVKEIVISKCESHYSFQLKKL